jgi:hypothetical protein
MEMPDEVVLTKFLITCFSELFEGLAKPLEKNGPKNLDRHKRVEGDLTYLQTTAGNVYRHQIDGRLFLGHEGDREQIWCLNIMVDIPQEALGQTKLNAFELRAFCMEARLRGLIITRDHIDHGRPFSLFDIPKHQRAGPKPGSSLSYEETIDDNFDFFGGAEEIIYRPDFRAKPILVYRANFQGGRL